MEQRFGQRTQPLRDNLHCHFSAGASQKVCVFRVETQILHVFVVVAAIPRRLLSGPVDAPVRRMESASTPADRPFVLVVALDLEDTDSSGYALNQAARMAMRIANSEMHLVYVIPTDGAPKDVHETASQLKRYVAAKATELGGLARQTLGIHLRGGDAPREIAQLATDVSADAIIVGIHKPAPIKDMFVSSTASRVMATATCPVFVAGPRPTPHPSHVVVIEPPCPDCVQARAASEGRIWWCARHSERHHLHGRHHYSYQTASAFADHDVDVVPRGM
jgi:nucleotide-binding universal stress UspA family protein